MPPVSVRLFVAANPQATAKNTNNKNIMAKKDALNWFEIYVTDFDRAKRFYEAILNAKLQEAPCGEGRMAVFPYNNETGIGGSITQMDSVTPGAGGTLVYLNAEGDLDGVVERIPGAGGSVLKARTSIGEHGFIAIFKDTEGNCLGLHSMK